MQVMTKAEVYKRMDEINNEIMSLETEMDKLCEIYCKMLRLESDQ